jgi:hypothetical protein
MAAKPAMRALPRNSRTNLVGTRTLAGDLITIEKLSFAGASFLS